MMKTKLLGSHCTSGNHALSYPFAYSTYGSYIKDVYIFANCQPSSLAQSLPVRFLLNDPSPGPCGHLVRRQINSCKSYGTAKNIFITLSTLRFRMSEGPNKRGELKFGLAKHFSKSRQIYLIIIFELIHYLGSST